MKSPFRPFPTPTAPPVPILGEPAKVLGILVLVTVACNQCARPSPIILAGAQQAGCPHCGAVYGLDRVLWDRRDSVPKITLNSTPSQASPLLEGRHQ
jgi:hypothetical protein